MAAGQVRVKNWLGVARARSVLPAAPLRHALLLGPSAVLCVRVSSVRLTLAKFMNSIWCAGDEGAYSQKLCITNEVGNNTPICSEGTHTARRSESLC